MKRSTLFINGVAMCTPFFNTILLSKCSTINSIHIQRTTLKTSCESAKLIGPGSVRIRKPLYNHMCGSAPDSQRLKPAVLLNHFSPY